MSQQQQPLESSLAASLARARADISHVIHLRSRLQHLLSFGVLSRYAFRRLPALRALLTLLDTLPCDSLDGLAFAAPLPPAVVGGVMVQSLEKDDAISIPTALLRLHLTPDAWDPQEELNLMLVDTTADISNPASPISHRQHSNNNSNNSPSGAAGGATSSSPQNLLSSTSKLQPVFSGAVTAVETELAWRALQGTCVLSPSQRALAADERLFEAAMSHVRHALKISPLVEMELMRTQVQPSGTTMHALSVLRVALAAIPAVEVVCRRSVAALRLAVSSGFISFLFRNVLGVSNCAKALKSAALDLLSTLLWNCHYCVPRGVVALFTQTNVSSNNTSYPPSSSGGLMDQQQPQHTQQQPQSSSSPNSNPVSSRTEPAGRNTPPIAASAATEQAGGSTGAAVVGAIGNRTPKTSPRLEQSQQLQQSSSSNANNNNQADTLVTSNDYEIASAIASLIAIVRAELVLLEKRDGGGNPISGLQTVDDILFSMIHLKDPSGIPLWTVPPATTTTIGTSSSQQATSGGGIMMMGTAASATTTSAPSPDQQQQHADDETNNDTTTANNKDTGNITSTQQGGAGTNTDLTLGGTASTLVDSKMLLSSMTSTGGGADAAGVGGTSTSAAAAPPPPVSMPALRLGGLNFLSSLAGAGGGGAYRGSGGGGGDISSGMMMGGGGGGGDFSSSGAGGGVSQSGSPQQPFQDQSSLGADGGGVVGPTTATGSGGGGISVPRISGAGGVFGSAGAAAAAAGVSSNASAPAGGFPTIPISTLRLHHHGSMDSARRISMPTSLPAGAAGGGGATVAQTLASARQQAQQHQHHQQQQQQQQGGGNVDGSAVLSPGNTYRGQVVMASGGGGGGGGVPPPEAYSLPGGVALRRSEFVNRASNNTSNINHNSAMLRNAMEERSRTADMLMMVLQKN